MKEKEIKDGSELKERNELFDEAKKNKINKIKMVKNQNVLVDKNMVL